MAIVVESGGKRLWRHICSIWKSIADFFSMESCLSDDQVALQPTVNKAEVTVQAADLFAGNSKAISDLEMDAASDLAMDGVVASSDVDDQAAKEVAEELNSPAASPRNILPAFSSAIQPDSDAEEAGEWCFVSSPPPSPKKTTDGGDNLRRRPWALWGLS